MCLFGKKTRKTNKNLLLSGVMILAVANILIKVIGLLYKIPLQSILTDEGMGYFNAAYRIYVIFYMVSTAGLPSAVSILVAESRAKGNMRETRYIFKITLRIFLIVGALGTSIMMIGAGPIANAVQLDGSKWCIMAIAPTIFFICLSSAVRGYYQGFQNMSPTAISELIEALGKLALGILFAVYAINRGYSLPVVAAFSISGLTVGVLIGMVYLFLDKSRFRDAEISSEFLKADSDVLPIMGWKEIAKRLITIAIPITISASVMSLADVVDLAIISGRLQSIGYTEEVAAALYGNYTTLCVPLFNLPPVLIYPISYSIVPYISSALSIGDKEKANVTINSSLRIASLIAIPSSLGLSVLSKPILSLLFHNEESVERAWPLLSILSLSVFFIGMLSVTNAVLQANHQERMPIISMVSGAVVKLIASYVLIGIPGIEMYGAPIGTFACYLTATVLNFLFLAKRVGLTPDVKKVFLRPLFASMICGLAAIGSYLFFDLFLPAKVATLGAILFAVLVYLLAVFLFRAVGADDIRMIPKGEKIVSLLKKFRLIRE